MKEKILAAILGIALVMTPAIADQDKNVVVTGNLSVEENAHIAGNLTIGNSSANLNLGNNSSINLFRGEIRQYPWNAYQNNTLWTVVDADKTEANGNEIYIPTNISHDWWFGACEYYAEDCGDIWFGADWVSLNLTTGDMIFWDSVVGESTILYSNGTITTIGDFKTEGRVEAEDMISEHLELGNSSVPGGITMFDTLDGTAHCLKVYADTLTLGSGAC